MLQRSLSQREGINATACALVAGFIHRNGLHVPCCITVLYFLHSTRRAVVENKIDPLQHAATCCNALQHTSAHCNALQRTATHCHTLQHTTCKRWSCSKYQIPPHCSTAIRSNALKHTALSKLTCFWQQISFLLHKICIHEYMCEPSFATKNCSRVAMCVWLKERALI